MTKKIKKIDQNEITKEDIVSFLETKETYLFEIKIAKLCESLGFKVEHSGSYVDPITQKRRQFDLRVFIKRKNLIIRLAIECKYIKESYPILVCTSPRVDSESYHCIIKSYNMNGRRKDISDFNNFNTFEFEKNIHSYYKSGIFIGRSIEQVGKENNKLTSDTSEISDKWTQALNQSHDLIHIAEKDYKYNEGYNTFIAILPALVVPNHTIWTAKVTNAENISENVIKTNEIDVYFGDNSKITDHNDNTFIFSHLKVLTLLGLESLLNEIADEDRDIWKFLFPGKK